MQRVNGKWILVVIFAIAIFFRIWFVLNYSAPLVTDETEYNRLALSLLEGKGYVSLEGHPTGVRPPGYSLFLSVLYFVCERNPFFVRIIQAFMGAFLCILVYQLGKKMFNEKTGILAGFLAAIHIGFIAHTARILTEGLTTFLLILAMIFFCNIIKGGKKRNYFFTGLFIGLTAMVRANFLIMFLLVMSIFMYDMLEKKYGLKQAMKCLAIYMTAFLVPVLPWTIRNYRVFHTFVPVSTHQGIALYTSLNPKDGKYYGFVADEKYEAVRKARMLGSEIEESRYLTEETINEIKKRPIRIFKLSGLKAAYLLSPFDWELIYNKIIYDYVYVFCIPFFVIGILKLMHRFGEMLPIILPILNIVIVALVFYGSPRFRVPVEPYIILLASWVIIELYEKVRDKKRFAGLLSLFLGVNYFLYANSLFIKEMCKTILIKVNLW